MSDQFIDIPPIAGGSGGFNLFQVPIGTNPNATLSQTAQWISSDDSVFITGNVGSNTIDLRAVNQAGLTSVASWLFPEAIVDHIDDIPTEPRAQYFIVGSGGPVTVTTFDDSVTCQELFLIGTDNTNTVLIPSTITNVKLSGDCTLRLGSMLSLQWITLGGFWLEVSRNDI